MLRRDLVMPPILGSIAILLSFRMTSRLESYTPALFSASKAMPPVIEPSPMTAMLCRSSSPFSLAAIDMPRAAEMEVEECPVPNESYSLSCMRGKPLMPPCRRLLLNCSLRPVRILWA